MATRGRKPKPNHLKVIDGNPGKRAINQHEPKAVGDLHAAPEWFSESQKQGWAYSIAHAPRGLLKLVDRSLLVTWVVAEDLHRQATEQLQNESLLTHTPNGMLTQNPLLQIINRQATVMHKAAAELGFTPSSRSRIKVEPDDETQSNPFGEFAHGS